MRAVHESLAILYEDNNEHNKCGQCHNDVDRNVDPEGPQIACPFRQIIAVLYLCILVQFMRHGECNSYEEHSGEGA